VINRASGPLLVAYILLLVAGIIFIVSTPRSINEATDYAGLSLAWSLFYIVGGVTSAVSITARRWVKNGLALWYFETAGLALLVTANFVYAYALARTGFQLADIAIVAVSLVITAFSSGLIARSIETLRLIKIMRGTTTSQRS